MQFREGLIPTALGTLVTGLGMSLRSDKPKLGWGITGFGLAHLLLGTLDLLDRSDQPGIQPTHQEPPQPNR